MTAKIPATLPAKSPTKVHAGTDMMPAWDVGELPPSPVFTMRNWVALIGPGLVMGGAAIGGGEWVTGPLVTAKYGGAMLWLATLSILGQVIYNIEISRYTLYTGEPIFTGKFRIPPGPIFWMFVYLVLDFGSFLPYLASNAATPLAAVMLGHIPNTKSLEPAQLMGWTAQIGDIVITEKRLMWLLSYVVFFAAIAPLLVGGKVYNSVKAIMSVKVFLVLGFLVFVAVCFSSVSTWVEIISGFFQFGTVPIERADGSIATQNVILSLLAGEALPTIDMSMIGVLCAMVAISGSGGLTNTTICAYTRDQGWGMGKHVGAIPSLIGGHKLELSHTGMVFPVTPEAMPRWRGWLRHVWRDQLVVWMPACFVGLALPAMLSVQFLPRGLNVEDNWLAAGMTAEGVGQAVGSQWGAEFGPVFFYLTLFCGVLILWPSTITTIDGFLRRWVDVVWVGLPAVRKWDPKRIGTLYSRVLFGYVILGCAAMAIGEPTTLLKVTGVFYNYALGFSCWQTLAVNTLLLPRELRPGWGNRLGLVLAGVFFLGLAIITSIDLVSKLNLFGG